MTAQATRPRTGAAIWASRTAGWLRDSRAGLVVIALGLILLALPQMYGVGYPVMYKAVAGHYVLWFLLVLAAGKIIACSTTLGIGGSGGVFAPSLFVGATSGMAFGELAPHVFGPAAGQPALYAVVAMGAVFTAAARAPLTSVASVVEMTGDFTLTLPVMLAVAIATATSRALSYGTIYTTKLLRRGQDIDRAAPWRAFGDLKAADTMRPFPLGIPGNRDFDSNSTAADGEPPLPGRLIYQGDPQTVYAGESLAQTLRQLKAYGRDGLPVLSADGRKVEGWITNHSVLQTVAAQIGSSPPRESTASGPATAGRQPGQAEPPTPLRGYRLLEVSVGPDSPAVRRPLRSLRWPPGSIPVAILRQRSLRDPDPDLTLAEGDRVSLLAPGTSVTDLSHQPRPPRGWRSPLG